MLTVLLACNAVKTGNLYMIQHTYFTATWCLLKTDCTLDGARQVIFTTQHTCSTATWCLLLTDCMLDGASRAQELSESRGGRPGLPSLINLWQHFNVNDEARQIIFTTQHTCFTAAWCLLFNRQHTG